MINVEVRCIQDIEEIQKLKTLNLKNGAEYKIQRLLGEGVFGIVFECLDEENEKIAAKIMKKTNEPPDTWKIELHILEKVAKFPHDNIIRFLSVESLQVPPKHCTEHVIVTNALGPSVLDVVNTAEKLLNNEDQGCTFPTADIRSIGRQVVAAMAHLDTVVGVYHLDLKPENIYFVGNGAFSIERLPSRHAQIKMHDTMVQLGDFGCSKFHKHSEADVKPTMVQTQNYRAPEVFLGLPYSMKSDVWSFGAMMCELYTGELLFFGTDDQHSEAAQFEMMQRVVGQYCSRAMMRKALSAGSEKIRKQVGVLQRTGKKFEPTPPLHMNIKKFDVAAIALFKFLADVLIFDPEHRPTFHDLQKHKFFN